MKKHFILTPLLFFSIGMLAQDQQPAEWDDIVTDRPDQTEAADLLPKGAIQIETGTYMEKQTILDRPFQTFAYNTTLLRFGIAEHFELRIIQEYLHDSYDGNSLNTGFGPLTIGTKIGMMEEKGFLPKISLNAHLAFRTGLKEYQPSHVTPDFRFLFVHSLSDRFTLSYNLGAEWNGEDAVATGIYTLSLGIGIIDRLGCFVELYGFLPEGQTADHRFDAGVTFLVAKNFQIDVSGGVGLSDVSPDQLISAGLSWRFPK